MTRRWVHSDRVDEPLAYENYQATGPPASGTVYDVYNDRMGSIVMVVDPATQIIAAQYEYDSFGNRTQILGTESQPYGFTGREFDGESGLHYFRARHLDTGLGQFVQRDPIGFAAGDLNIYAYVDNDPYNMHDPSGLSPSVEHRAKNRHIYDLTGKAFDGVLRGLVKGLDKLNDILYKVIRKKPPNGNAKSSRVSQLVYELRVKDGKNRGQVVKIGLTNTKNYTLRYLESCLKSEGVEMVLVALVLGGKNARAKGLAAEASRTHWYKATYGRKPARNRGFPC